MSKRAPIYHAGRASVVCSLALLDGHFHEKWTYVILGPIFLIKKRGKKRERKRESSLVVYWLTLLSLFVSRSYVVTTTLPGKLVKAAISNEEVPSWTPGRSYFSLLFAARRRL